MLPFTSLSGTLLPTTYPSPFPHSGHVCARDATDFKQVVLGFQCQSRLPVLRVQVMYAYVMRPETLNRSYWDFIARTGPIAKPVLKAVKSTVRAESVDLAELTSYIR